MTRTSVIVLASALVLAACGPQPSKDAKAASKPVAAKARKCPDPDIRDTKDPCSVAYLTPHKPRFKGDILK
ncbi:hypothetical protein [Caulobacter sp. CCH5-E12]|uniref:hypothetical protein n=1 Tax=Caulobacter sp. CCH5-E12 TaxID=1768770 RepID=UPI0007837AAF|nr:hypothetical protein [Caulobacter sp. CCH5-E12]